MTALKCTVTHWWFFSPNLNPLPEDSSCSCVFYATAFPSRFDYPNNTTHIFLFLDARAFHPLFVLSSQMDQNTLGPVNFTPQLFYHSCFVWLIILQWYLCSIDFMSHRLQLQNTSPTPPPHTHRHAHSHVTSQSYMVQAVTFVKEIKHEAGTILRRFCCSENDLLVPNWTR
jgi:hypothetical protein